MTSLYDPDHVPTSVPEQISCMLYRVLNANCETLWYIQTSPPPVQISREALKYLSAYILQALFVMADDDEDPNDIVSEIWDLINTMIPVNEDDDDEIDGTTILPKPNRKTKANKSSKRKRKRNDDD
jgi:hypothetical protein